MFINLSTRFQVQKQDTSFDLFSIFEVAAAI